MWISVLWEGSDNQLGYVTILKSPAHCWTELMRVHYDRLHLCEPVGFSTFCPPSLADSQNSLASE